MINSIRNNNLTDFKALNEAKMEDFYKHESLRTQIFSYYKQHTDQYKSDFLNKKMRSEKAYDKQYGVDITGPSSDSDNERISSTHHQGPKRVIVLSRPGCPWCTKTKEFLKSKHISYTEYNVQTSSRGKALFKKHNGSGVPLVIVGDTVLRGYDPDGIMGAL